MYKIHIYTEGDTNSCLKDRCKDTLSMDAGSVSRGEDETEFTSMGCVQK